MKHLRSMNEEVEQDDWYVLPTNTTIDTLERILMEAWQLSDSREIGVKDNNKN